MKGVKSLRPISHRYVAQWDPQAVLDFLKGGLYVPARSIKLELLAKKTLMLILLASVNRVEIATALCISKDKMSHENSVIKFHVERADLKQGSRVKEKPKPIKIKAFEQKSIDPVHYIVTYIERTKKMRGDIPQLFITSKGPVKPIARNTAKRWVREVMSQSGINTDEFGPGSVRGASSSKGSSSGASLEEILGAGGWSSASVWQKNYNRPILERKRSMTEIYFK